MRTSIESMRRYGSRYLVTLACGHATIVNADQSKASQYFIGKPITCGEKHKESK